MAWKKPSKIPPFEKVKGKYVLFIFNKMKDIPYAVFIKDENKYEYVFVATPLPDFYMIVDTPEEK
jgi:hypothetical protein